MRITIDLDIPPSEIGAATELLSLLRALTDHAKGGQANGPAARFGPPGQANGPAHQASVTIQNLPALLEDCIKRLQDPTQVQDVAKKVTSLISDPSPETMEANITKLNEVLCGIMLHPDVVKANHPPEEFLAILPQLPEPIGPKLKDKILRSVVLHLNRQRDIKTDRDELRIYAMAFAALVQQGAIAFGGSLMTINTLLAKTPTQAAAMTMLGCLIEKCYERFTDGVDADKQALLRQHLASSAMDPEFNYDLDYVFECFGWEELNPVRRQQQPVAAPAAIAQPIASGPPPLAAAPFGPPRVLPHPAGAVIFSMAYAPATEHQNQSWLACGDAVGSVIFWARDERPEPVKKLSVRQNSYFCTAMDFITSAAALLVAGQSGQDQSSIFCFANPMDWSLVGQLKRPRTTRIPAIKTLNDGDFTFATGETINMDTGASVVTVCLYDMGISPSFEELTPISTMYGHSMNITSIATLPGMPGHFATGSLDKTVRIWDKRLGTQVGYIGDAQHGCHANGVTCIDVRDNLMLTGSADMSVCCWDIRSLGQGGQHLFRVDTGAPVLRLAFGPAWAGAAVTSTNRLLTLDTQPSTPNDRRLKLVADGTYTNVQWDTFENNRLYAAWRSPDAASSRVDVFPYLGGGQRG